jgi:hypothetical protein
VQVADALVVVLMPVKLVVAVATLAKLAVVAMLVKLVVAMLRGQNHA